MSVSYFKKRCELGLPAGLSQFHKSVVFITDMSAWQHSNFCPDRLLANDRLPSRPSKTAQRTCNSSWAGIVKLRQNRVGLTEMPGLVD
jgi:hypothetical protein